MRIADNACDLWMTAAVFAAVAFAAGIFGIREGWRKQSCE